MDTSARLRFARMTTAASANCLPTVRYVCMYVCTYLGWHDGFATNAYFAGGRSAGHAGCWNQNLGRHAAAGCGGGRWRRRSRPGAYTHTAAPCIIDPETTFFLLSQQNVDLQQIEKLLEGGLPKPKPVAAAAAAAAAAALIPGQPAYHYHPRMHHPQHPHGVVVRAGGAAVRHAVIHMDDVHRMVHARRRGGVMVQPMHMAMPMPMPVMPQLPIPGHAHVMRNHMPPPAMPLQMNLPPPATPIAAMPIPPQQRPAKAMAIEAHNLEPRGNRKRARVNNDGR